MEPQRRPHIIVTSVHLAQYSETFIRNHVQGLPYTVHYLYGGYLANNHSTGTLIAPWLFRLFPIGRPFLEKALLRYIFDQDISAVLAEYGPVGVHWAPVCKKVGVPLFVYFHGYDATKGSVLKEYGSRYKSLFQQAAGIFVVSRAMERKLIDMGAPAEKVIFAPCGADMELFLPKMPSEKPVLLSVGRFADTKSPETTIKAFAKALEQVPDAELRMAGKGELLPGCRALVMELGIEDNVEFLGVIKPEEVYKEMQGARAFVQHSVTTEEGETEGSPVAIMEAGAAGLPVIATRHAGIPEMVLHGETGLLVDEHDVQGMADAMVRILTDKELADRLGQAAHQHIAEHYSLQRNLRILTEAINKVI